MLVYCLRSIGQLGSLPHRCSAAAGTVASALAAGGSSCSCLLHERHEAHCSGLSSAAWRAMHASRTASCCGSFKGTCSTASTMRSSAPVAQQQQACRMHARGPPSWLLLQRKAAFSVGADSPAVRGCCPLTCSSRRLTVLAVAAPLQAPTQAQPAATTQELLLQQHRLVTVRPSSSDILAVDTTGSSSTASTGVQPSSSRVHTRLGSRDAVDNRNLLTQSCDLDSSDSSSSSSSSRNQRPRRRLRQRDLDPARSISVDVTSVDVNHWREWDSVDSSSNSISQRTRRRRRQLAPAVEESTSVASAALSDKHCSGSSSSSRERTKRQQQQQPDVVAVAEQSSSATCSDDKQHELLVQQQQHHQQQQQQATKMLLLGIDPDTNGAIAVVSADLLPYSQMLPESCSGGSSSNQLLQQQQQQQQPLFGVDLSSASVSLYDMPVEEIALKKKSKAAPQRYRRRLDVPRSIALIRLLLQQQYQVLLQQHQQQQAAAHSANSSSSRDATSSSVRPPLLRAFLEVSSIMPTNGSLSTLNQGYSIGAWQAVLLALGFEVCSVHAKQWKKGLGLLKADKDDSRALAGRLYAGVGQCQQHIISRKKDHGRAEALLIAAWGCGWSAQQPAAGSSKGPSSSSSSSSSSKDGSAMLHQGPLRDVVQMDGSMHMLASSSSSSSSSGGVEGADCANGDAATAAAFVPAGAAAMTKAPKKAKQLVKAAPKKLKERAQATAGVAVEGQDVAASSAAQQAADEPSTGRLSKQGVKATRKKFAAAT